LVQKVAIKIYVAAEGSITDSSLKMKAARSSEMSAKFPLQHGTKIPKLSEHEQVVRGGLSDINPLKTKRICFI
jgi:hypothetical protein